MCNVTESSHGGQPTFVMDLNTNIDRNDEVKISPGPKKKQWPFGKLIHFVQKHTQRQTVPYKNIDLTNFAS